MIEFMHGIVELVEMIFWDEALADAEAEAFALAAALACDANLADAVEFDAAHVFELTAALA